MAIHNTARFWQPELSTVLDCTVGERTVIHSHVWIGDNVIIGNDCKIQAFAFIPEGVTIGNRVFVGPRVTFTNDKNPPSGRANWLPTYIEDDVSIGAGTVILPGLRVGKGALIGAGSVVTKDVLPGTRVKGNPAREF